MNPRRSKRGWLAGLFAGVAAVGTVLLLQVLFELMDREPVPPAAFSEGARWYDLALIRMEYLGPNPMDLIEAKSSYAVGMLLALGALFVVTAVGTWWAARGSAPGSSVFPVFLSVWMSFIVGAALGRSAQSMWTLRDSLGDDGMLLIVVDTGLRSGPDYGLFWGFPLAVIVALLWLMVRPRATAQAEGLPPGQQQPPPYDAEPPRIEEPMWATTVQDPPSDPEYDTRAMPAGPAQPDDGPDLTKRAD
ncbi:hypothetical protein [Nocardioides speluncae]|uniref:hypothetical protein n=1 Tax=Nocardioides speluncae TaxID=2670337 RepID=UPI000D69B664|nr:hypothetical protein [Nocardioides speluncae]